LVVVKAILYKRTIALGTRIDFRKDLRRSEPRGDGDGSGWRKKAVQTGGRIHNNTENTPREIFSACSQRIQTYMHDKPASQSLNHSFIRSINQSSFFVCSIIRACTSTSIHFRRAGQRGPTRTLTAALKRVIKQLLGTYSIEQVKYYKHARKLEKNQSVDRSVFCCISGE